MRKTLVLTSINPYKRVDFQKRCFEKWKQLGLTVKSFNIEEERNLLINHGFDLDDLQKITTNETSSGLFGKPIPRILPILNYAVHQNFDSFVLVNSDIYPAVDKSPMDLLLSLSGQLALTRNDVTYVENYSLSRDFSYRGGLDIFIFSLSKIKDLFTLLLKNPVSERMTFGIPGWDYYLVERMFNSGKLLILDSHVFIHEFHTPTYCEIDEFKHYSRLIASGLGWEHAGDVNEDALKVVSFINENCDRNTDVTRLLSLTYGKNIKCFEYASEGEKEYVLAVYIHLLNQPWLILSDVEYGILIKSFILRVSHGVQWSSVIDFFSKHLPISSCIPLRLMFLYITLTILKMNGSLVLSTLYPKGNMHAKAVEQILTNTKSNNRDLYIFDLFATELVDYKIFNENLFDYILYCVDNKNYFKLIYNVNQLIRG